MEEMGGIMRRGKVVRREEPFGGWGEGRGGCKLDRYAGLSDVFASLLVFPPFGPLSPLARDGQHNTACPAFTFL